MVKKPAPRSTMITRSRSRELSAQSNTITTSEGPSASASDEAIGTCPSPSAVPLSEDVVTSHTEKVISGESTIADSEHTPHESCAPSKCNTAGKRKNSLVRRRGQDKIPTTSTDALARPKNGSLTMPDGSMKLTSEMNEEILRNSDDQPRNQAIEGSQSASLTSPEGTGLTCAIEAIEIAQQSSSSTSIIPQAVTPVDKGYAPFNITDSTNQRKQPVKVQRKTLGTHKLRNSSKSVDGNGETARPPLQERHLNASNSVKANPSSIVSPLEKAQAPASEQVKIAVSLVSLQPV
jgi:hypothetical protein